LPKSAWKKVEEGLKPYPDRKEPDKAYYVPLFPAPKRRDPPVGETSKLTLGEPVPFILCHRLTLRIPLMPIWARTRYHYQICENGPEGLPIALFPATRLRE
jgi:hypothetical protein